MTNIIKSFATLLLLSACGGGGGADDVEIITPDDTNEPTGDYIPFSDTSAASSIVSSAGIATNQTTGLRTVTTQSGSYDHATAQAMLNDANVITFTDTVLGDYDYVTTFAASDAASDISGVLGIATSDADMPPTGSTTYTGGAVGVVVTANSGIDLIDGTSTVVVNFGTGFADLTLNGFTAINQLDGQPTAAPIDEISVTGLVISGSSFSGTNVSTTLAGIEVDITGDNTISATNGGFFGLTDTMPDEVGGVVISEGDNGTVSGTFLAD